MQALEQHNNTTANKANGQTTNGQTDNGQSKAQNMQPTFSIAHKSHNKANERTFNNDELTRRVRDGASIGSQRQTAGGLEKHEVLCVRLLDADVCARQEREREQRKPQTLETAEVVGSHCAAVLCVSSRACYSEKSE